MRIEREKKFLGFYLPSWFWKPAVYQRYAGRRDILVDTGGITPLGVMAVILAISSAATVGLLADKFEII
jgi:hypothetical protein